LDKKFFKINGFSILINLDMLSYIGTPLLFLLIMMIIIIIMIMAINNSYK